MSDLTISRRALLAAGAAGAMVIALTGCGSPQKAASGGGGSTAPVNVGIVYSQTGALATYGAERDGKCDCHRYVAGG